MRGFYEFHKREDAEARHTEIARLGWSAFSVFQTARGTWAFHVN